MTYFKVIGLRRASWAKASGHVARWVIATWHTVFFDETSEPRTWQAEDHVVELAAAVEGRQQHETGRPFQVVARIALYSPAPYTRARYPLIHEGIQP